MQNPASGSHGLTRELLASGEFRRLLQQADPTFRVVTDEERAACLGRTLACKPDTGPVWVFAYGSLLWNPTVQVAERAVVTALGWHRKFCLWTPLGRGTAEMPGLMLGLEHGGSCRGVALRVDGDVTTELDLLWRREMVGNSYRPRWLAVAMPDGSRGHALGFTINHAGRSYARAVPDTVAATHIANACGQMGPCRDYFEHTLGELRRAGIRDRHMERIARLLPAI